VYPVPVELHVSGMFPLHCFCPGEQVPVHAPAAHVPAQLTTLLQAVPVGLHCSTTLPAHRHAEGVQVVASTHCLVLASHAWLQIC